MLEAENKKDVNGKPLDTVFGMNDKDWAWQLGGSVNLPAGETRLALHDVTGFCGRCDAIFFSRDDTSSSPPAAIDETTRAWRRRLRGLPDKPVDGGIFDVIVVGGGVPGEGRCDKCCGQDLRLRGK
jgi:hypothetical protein